LIHGLTIEVADHPVSLELDGDAFLHPITKVYHQFFSDRYPECRLRIYADDNLTIVWFIPSLATFVRNLFTLLLVLKGNGLVLHALGVLKGGEVYVFFGPSGSGKTTVAALSPEHVILSDDIVFIKPFGRSYAVFPTPCWGDMQRGDRENRGYPLKMMFKLVKDGEVYLKPYGLAQGISEIFTVPHIPENSVPLGDLLKRYHRLLTEVPCFEMHFAKDGRFWQAIEREDLSLASEEG
jgi:hypothetical protein